MLSIENEVTSNSQKATRQWRPFAKGIKRVLVAGFKTHDWMQDSNNREFVGKTLLALGFGLLEKTNPPGATVVKIGVAVYLTSLESSTHNSLE